VRRVGGAKNELIAVEEIYQAGIASHKLAYEGHDATENFLEAWFPDHEAADPLKKAELLFGTLQSLFQLADSRHRLYYRRIENRHGGCPQHTKPERRK